MFGSAEALGTDVDFRHVPVIPDDDNLTFGHNTCAWYYLGGPALWSSGQPLIARVW